MLTRSGSTLPKQELKSVFVSLSSSWNEGTADELLLAVLAELILQVFAAAGKETDWAYVSLINSWNPPAQCL